MLRRTRILLPLAALLALPAASAQAASVSVVAQGAAVSTGGAAQVAVKNPTGRTVTGTASLAAGRATLASRSVRLPGRATTRLTFRLDAKGLDGLRAAGGEATVKLALGRPGGRRTTVTRKLTLALPGGAPAPKAGAQQTPPPAPQPPAPAPAPQPLPQPAPPPAPAPPVSWKAQVGTDSVSLELRDGQFTFADVFWMPVTCTEVNGAGRSRTMRDRFVVRGPWSANGDSAPQERSSVSINDLVGTAFRPMTFSVTGAALQPGRLTGTLHIAFTGRPWTGAGYTDVECSAAQPFEAVPTA